MYDCNDHSCPKCIHYYVTWDQHYPYGCRAMGFKSKHLPINDVRMAMEGKDCLSFETKKSKFQLRSPSVINKH